MKVTAFLILISFFSVSQSFAQDSISANWLFQFGYGYQIGFGDFNSRYGDHGKLGVTILKKMKTWEIGPSFKYYFGSQVKEDVLHGLRTPEGDLIGGDHQLAQVDLRLRGMLMGIRVNREFKVRNSPHAIVVGLKPAFLMHWIRFQNPGNTFEPINGEYRYGYDRYSSGVALEESLAYRYQSTNRLINFEIELTCTQANTVIRRNMQFDQPNLGDQKQKDGLIGLTVKWILPIFKASNPDKIYY